jgi:serine/threonine-protein kinase RsbW
LIPSYGVIVRARRLQVRTKRSPGPASSPAKLPPEFLLRLELQSNPEILCVVRAAIERATETLDFAPEQSWAVVRAVDEALANVLRHAYKGEAGRSIEVVCSRVPLSQEHPRGGIEIVLRDSGQPINPAKLHGRDLNDLRPGGLGLHFIKQSMDKVEFSRQGGQNQLRLVKYLAPMARAKAASA